MLRVKYLWGYDSKIVYPPVDIEKFSVVRDNRDRDGVITIGRFTPEKNHLLQLEIAKQLPNLTFRLVGSANTPYYQRWFNVVKSRVEMYDLKNVELYTNVSFKKLVELIGSSKYFIHSMFNEDFGLTTCEAIGGGCIPVVHNSGGQIEIVPFKELRWKTVSEAIKIIRNIRNHSFYLDKLWRHIQNFSCESFMNNMVQVIGL
jgi:glycosyltransferase involved in cell wall biosynthesis